MSLNFRSKKKKGPRSERTWHPILLVLIIFLVSSPIFLVPYLFADEGNVIAGLHPHLRDLISHWGPRFWGDLRSNGRPVAGIISRVVDWAVFGSPMGFRMIRILCVAICSGLAVVVWSCIRLCGVSSLKALLLTLMIFFHQALFVFGAYIMLLPHLLGMAASIFASWLVIKSSERNMELGVKRAVIITALYLFGLLSYQGSSFFGLPLLALYLLSGGARKRKTLGNVSVALLLFLATVASYSLVFRFVLLNEHSYPLAQTLFNSLEQNRALLLKAALTPARYWQLFEFWNYPFPIQATIRQVRLAAEVVLIIWLVLLFVGYCVESGKRKRVRWSLAVGLGALSFLPIVADCFTQRQPVLAPAVLTFFLLGFVAYKNVTTALNLKDTQRRLVFAGALCVVVWSGVGAYMNLSERMVEPAIKLLRFVQDTAIASSPQVIDTVIVTLPGGKKSMACNHLPLCVGYFDRQLPDGFHLLGSGLYANSLIFAGFKGKMKLMNSSDNHDPVILEKSLNVDWNQFSP